MLTNLVRPTKCIYMYVYVCMCTACIRGNYMKSLRNDRSCRLGAVSKYSRSGRGVQETYAFVMTIPIYLMMNVWYS